MSHHKPGVRPGRGDAATRDALAGEYALGTLGGPARRRFERLLAVDADLRRRVRAWEERLAPLGAEVDPVEPPSTVWRGIERRLGLSHAGASAEVRQLWNSLPLWRGLAVAATLLLAIVAVWSWAPGPAPEATDRMAVITSPDNVPLWVVSTGSDGEMVRVRTLRPAGMAPERVCPLWLKWKDGRRIQRVGILPERRGVYTFKVPGDMPVDRARLAVSVEPAGDVPRDRPRGKVVYEGGWVRL